MSQMTRFALTGTALLAICAAFAGCSARTNASATASTPAQFTHVFVTAQAVWFNTNGDAGPDDSGWAKFQLKNPVTVDLVTESNGTLGEIANDLRVAPGTYNSILLLPVDPTLAVTASAQAAGATFNQEADYVDPTGASHQVQLVLPNPEKGIVVPGSTLKVPVGGTGSGLAIGSTTSTTSTTSTANTTNSASTLFGSPTTINPTTSTTTGTSTTNKTITVSFASSFDGNRDLHTFVYNSNQLPGVFFSASGLSADLATSGGISGTLSLSSLTSLTPVTNPSGRINIQACAESLSADNTHHAVVACSPVQTDGTFTIYPLPSNSSNPLSYDVVIHGPRIATIIVKNVVVTTTTPTLTPAASTAGSVATTTASGAVSLGTLTPTQTVQFPVTATAAAGALPAGAAVTFYQSLPASGEVPYAIDAVGIDPFNATTALFPPSQIQESLSAGPIVSGTYASNGSTITLTSANVSGTYLAAATAPLYTDGIASSSVKVQAPTSTQGTSAVDATAAVAIVVPALTGTSAAAINATITPSSPGKYNQGELIVSHNGAVIGSADISAALGASGATVTVPGLPSGNTYYLSVIVWNSAQVSQDAPFVYQSIATPVNLSGGSATAEVTIN
jgi:Domain of unknown function (DUF4382)